MGVRLIEDKEEMKQREIKINTKKLKMQANMAIFMMKLNA
jgi:hypothetical protein